ncbi:uncharacterized protein DS421_5g160070 [Arachis hypogaea]|uniref:non-specific serine/threonine protein kinase n=1 Tax=Arachis hypogaea TaxID=3818 RepID=A0A445D253_ARAHY|nr:uncharacterized protein DS421_5g160070 [Arachis hypogaea]RYR57272.1 hypothetical protein Ahy_A05g022995 [Arachis hypogaea]
MLKLALFFLLVLFPLLFHSSLGNNIINTTSSSTLCGTKSCPNGPNISYPFWLSHGSPPQEYCGYPEFGLICLDDGNTIFSPPPGLYYYVKHIDYDNHSIKLIDFDTTNQTCPRALHGFPIGNLPLSHSSLNLNLSFYYNCSTSTTSHPSNVPDISCLRQGSKESFVFLKGNESKGFDWSERCEENVDVTVMKDEISSNGGEYGLVSEFGRAMNEGFVLEWETEETCKECEASEGYCGYSSTNKQILCFCKDGTVRTNNCQVAGESKSRLSKLIIGFIAAGIGVLPITCIILYIFRHKLSPIMPEILKIKNNDQDIEAFMKTHGPIAIKRYTYSDIKKMTNSFESKLGEGGYGEVYKGFLNNGGLVAVKLLKASKGNGEEFINEVTSISKTSHVNIVALLGFCLEGNKKKALVYEFMLNGSLEKYIHNNDPITNPPLSWERLHRIAKGIARGLEYLHRGCNTRILHFDIKPNNILLDKNFNPKISDFGLAKLCSKTHSIVTMLDARGTIGYIAPEVWNRHFGGVSHKSDVYSYGMMILEMVGGKHNNTNAEVTSHSSELYFSHWIYKHIESDKSSVAWQGATMSNEEGEIVRKMIIVGLWCIQTIPSERPPMSRVIEMLEGSIDLLQSPPKPFNFSPTQTKVESCTTSSTSDSFSPAD